MKGSTVDRIIESEFWLFFLVGEACHAPRVVESAGYCTEVENLFERQRSGESTTRFISG